LRLADRCSPFRNGGPNSLSAAEYYDLPPFITGVDSFVVQDSLRLIAASLRGDDFKEALAAMAEKRRPRFADP
jgi:hypothetical protein